MDARLPGWTGTGYNTTGATNVEIVANQMVVLDEDGNGCGCHRVAVWAPIVKGKCDGNGRSICG
jgi:hypothetical protein